MYGLLFSLLAASPSYADDIEPPKKMMKKVGKREGCPRDTMAAEYLDSETTNRIEYTSWRITGCGDEFMLTWATSMGMWLYYDDRDLRKKAPFDLDCDAGELTYTLIDPRNRGVEGCERRATYVYTDSGWVANVATGR